MVSSSLSLLRGINSTFGVSVADRLLRALITLGIGGAIYLTVSIMPKTYKELRASLRWIYIGFSFALVWGTVQTFYIVHFSPAYYHWVNRIHKYISTRRLFENRVSGLTFEPNWFAEQISLLILPWLLAAVMNRYSIFAWRWRRVTIEWLLLVWSIGVLVFTFSRTGLFILFTLLFVSLLFFKPVRKNLASQKQTFIKRWGRRLVEALLVILAICAFVFAVGSNNYFFSRIWNYWSERGNTNLAGYIDYLGFNARFTYNATAFRIYNEYPVLGVGLGNYAFYFEDMMPERLLAEAPEVLHLLTINVTRYRLMTPKNLYVRILAETGLVGMATFLAFIIAILGCGLYLYLSPDDEQKYWGTASIYLLVAFSLSALSFDSFAIPNMWIVFGMITAATWISKRSRTG